MQADRHHLRRAGLALGIERVEAVLQVGEELVAGIEALRRGEAHVVGVERIGDGEERALRPGEPVGQVVGIDVGGVEEAALLRRELDRVDRGAARCTSRAAARR